MSILAYQATAVFFSNFIHQQVMKKNFLAVFGSAVFALQRAMACVA